MGRITSLEPENRLQLPLTSLSHQRPGWRRFAGAVLFRSGKWNRWEEKGGTLIGIPPASPRSPVSSRRPAPSVSAVLYSSVLSVDNKQPNNRARVREGLLVRFWPPCSVSLPERVGQNLFALWYCSAPGSECHWAHWEDGELRRDWGLIKDYTPEDSC